MEIKVEFIKGPTKNTNIEVGSIINHIGERVGLHGSVYKIRRMSDFAFVLLRTKREVVQCIYSKDYAEFDLEVLKEESCIKLTADIIKEDRSKSGWELRMIDVEVLSEPIAESPIVINNKLVDTSLENLLDYRPITLRNEKERAIFKLQAGICHGFCKYFLEQSFTEIHSPKIVSAGAEGGANIFHLNYFGKDAFLAQSPQFYKQMMVGVYERVYEIAPVFRAEKHDTSRHLNEYISVDFEIGYIESFEDIMMMEVGMLRYALEELQANYTHELELLKITLPNLEKIPSIKFMEAKDLISEKYNRSIKDYEDFEPEEEKLLSEIIKKETGSDFVFVTHYPTAKRPFYAMEDPSNPHVTLSFDLLFRGLEISTGGQRIHSYKEQIQKMKRLNMNIELFETYLMIHKYGMPPHGGLGLGLERFTSKLLNQDNVRLSTLFPRDINRVTP
ncbi:MAG: aspartate--tRNA(Asn) ligase [Herbinix sp.]|nr:aspartate--tRNA(Asn) ligase [Herbinix sp.]